MADFRELIRDYLDAADFSKAAARRLEGQLDLLAPSAPDVQGLLDVLASYDPGGGDFLYDRAHLERALRVLDNKP